MRRFEGIKVFEDKTALVGRNSEQRVLFRYNRWTTEFSVYRSHRMTEVEIECILMQMDRLFKGKVPELAERKFKVFQFLNYETDEDTYCS